LPAGGGDEISIPKIHLKKSFHQKLTSSFLIFVLLFHVVSGAFLLSVKEAEASGSYSLSFDGVGDYMVTSSNDNLNFGTGDFSISVWVKLNVINTTTHSIVRLSYNTGVSADYSSAGFYETGGVIIAHSRGSTGGIKLASNVINSSIWYNLVLIRKSTVVYGYINGNPMTTTAVSDATFNYMNGGKIYIGASDNDGGGVGILHDGYIDDVKIYNRALLETEVSNLYEGIQINKTGIVSSYSFNEGSGENVYDSSGNDNDGVIYGANWSLESVNFSPQTVSSFSAFEESTSSSPVLDILAADPENDNMTVTFYGRENNISSADDFSIVVLPDTQNYSASYPAIFTTQTQWIVDNKNDKNIVFVSHEGDIVNADSVQQWGYANNSISILDGEVPYGLLPGNHDMFDSGVKYNTYFPYTRYENESWYGGHYGDSNNNNFQLFSVGDLDFIMLNLEYNPSSAVLLWADELLSTHSDRRAIVNTHSAIDSSGAFTAPGDNIYNTLKDKSNLFLILCGHLVTENSRTDIYNGNILYTLLADYQTRTNGGNGWLRILEFKPSENKIYVKTYSPYLDEYETDADSQFTLDYNLSDDDYSVLATNLDVASGSNSTYTWSGLTNGQQYEWYVTVSDGINTTTSSVYNFTVDGDNPASFGLSSPIDNAITSDRAPAFSWGASSDSGVGLAKYQLYIDDIMDKDGISDSATSTSPSNELSCGDHSWYVRAIDNNDNYTNSNIFNLNINCSGVFIPPTKPNITNIDITVLDNGNLTFDNLPDSITQIAISRTLDFSDASWRSFDKDKFSHISEVPENLYIKFRTDQGAVSDVIICEGDKISTTREGTDTSDTIDDNSQGSNTQILNDGDLVKTINSPDVYIVKYKNNKQYKRLILSPYVFSLYRHLQWENIKIVSQERLDQFTTSNLIKESVDSIIYQFFPDGDTGQRKPLDPLAIYDPDSVYEINKPEQDSYEAMN